METSHVHRRRLTVIMPAAAAVATAIAAGHYGDGGASLVPFIGWAVLPYVVLAVVIILAARSYRVSWLLASIAAVLAAAYGAWSIYDFATSSSSTAALVWIFMPLLQLGAALAAGIVLLVEFVTRPVRTDLPPVSVR